jgi:hypothetical protein
MQLLRSRRLPVWLVGALSVLLALAAAPSRVQGDQGARLGEALWYPDRQTVTLKYARVVLEVSINGKHSERDENRTLTESVNFQARVSYTQNLKALVTATWVRGRYVSIEHDPDVPSTSRSVFTFASSDTKDTPLGAQRAGLYPNLVVSKKYGATNFGLDAVNDSPWRDIPGHVVFTTTDPNGEYTSEDDLPCSVLARVPYHSSVGATPFAALANSWEAAGKDGDDRLVGGIIEAPWSKGGSFGSFSVPVLASCPMGLYTVNTKPAWDAEGETGPLYPGFLRVTWVLGEDAPVGRMTISPVDPDAYGAWGPAGGSGGAEPGGAATPSRRLAFRVAMAPAAAGRPAPKGRMDFWLREVGEESADAIRFVPGQANLVIDDDDPCHAYTRDGLSLSECTVEVEAHRPDAHGFLQAMCEELNLVAECEATGGMGIPIPREGVAETGAEG